MQSFSRIRRTSGSAIIMLALGASTLAPPAGAKVSAGSVSRHVVHAADTAAIRALLSSYTAAVTRGDRRAFEALLMGTDIPFASMDDLGPSGPNGFSDTHQYAQFRASIFDSGIRYSQRFYNVRIDQDGALANVRLDFVTVEAATGRGGYGWKTLQLVKVGDRWKIASEFFTGRPLSALRS